MPKHSRIETARTAPFCRRAALTLIVPMVMSSLPRAAHADTWLNSSGGSWYDGNNWSNGVPSNIYPAFIYFDLNSSYAVTMNNSSASVYDLEILAGQLTLNNAGLNVTEENLDVAANGGTAAFNLSGSIYIMAGAYVGTNSGTGTLICSGVVSATHGPIEVGTGSSAHGTFNTSGTVFSSDNLDVGIGGGNATLDVSGVLSIDGMINLGVGKNSSTQASFTNAKIYSNVGQFITGSESGTASVSMSGGQLDSYLITVGTGSDFVPRLLYPVPDYGGNGVFNMSNGATFLGPNVILIGGPGGHGVLNARDTGTIVGNLYSTTMFVGDGGFGQVNCSSGAQLQTGLCYIGGNGSNGSVIISGRGTQWNSSNGQVTVGTDYVGLPGTGLIQIDHQAACVISAGFNTALTLGSGGTVDLLSGGRLSVNSLQMSSGSVFEIGLDGTDPINNGYADIVQKADFDGSLDVILENGFVPTAGEDFTILGLASVTGAFTNVNLPPLQAGLDWDTSQLYTQGSISVVSSVPEPSGLIGLCGIGALIRRRRRRMSP